MEYEITNVTAKGNLGYELNLNRLAISLDNSEYEPEKFSGLIYRLPPATFLIYKSGKFICTGLKNKKKLKKQ